MVEIYADMDGHTIEGEIRRDHWWPLTLQHVRSHQIPQPPGNHSADGKAAKRQGGRGRVGANATSQPGERHRQIVVLCFLVEGASLAV